MLFSPSLPHVISPCLTHTSLVSSHLLNFPTLLSPLFSLLLSHIFQNKSHQTQFNQNKLSLISSYLLFSITLIIFISFLSSCSSPHHYIFPDLYYFPTQMSLISFLWIIINHIQSTTNIIIHSWYHPTSTQSSSPPHSTNISIYPLFTNHSHTLFSLPSVFPENFQPPSFFSKSSQNSYSNHSPSLTTPSSSLTIFTLPLFQCTHLPFFFINHY